MASSPTNLRSAFPLALLLGCAAVHQFLLSKQQQQQQAAEKDNRPQDPERDQELASHAYRQATFKQVMAAAAKAAPGELVLSTTEEWYMVAIEDVPMGYLHTTTVLDEERNGSAAEGGAEGGAEGDRGPLVTTTELMDVQARPRIQPQPQP